MRFLLHGMLFRTREGQIVLLKAHLLRQAFATHALQVEKYPWTWWGAWLKQKNLEVTDYYTRPTAGLIAGAADDYLARFSTFLNAGQLIERTPEELRKLHEDARGRIGALADVVGGHCTQPGFCPAKFACVGCSANASDPVKRRQIQLRLNWATGQREKTVRQGLILETARFDQDIRACHAKLREMDLVERWRSDEERGHLTILPVLKCGRARLTRCDRTSIENSRSGGHSWDLRKRDTAQRRGVRAVSATLAQNAARAIGRTSHECR
jgi:hypothetical protein